MHKKQTTQSGESVREREKEGKREREKDIKQPAEATKRGPKPDTGIKEDSENVKQQAKKEWTKAQRERRQTKAIKESSKNKAARNGKWARKLKKKTKKT